MTHSHVFLLALGLLACGGGKDASVADSGPASASTTGTTGTTGASSSGTDSTTWCDDTPTGTNTWTTTGACSFPDDWWKRVLCCPPIPDLACELQVVVGFEEAAWTLSVAGWEAQALANDVRWWLMDDLLAGRPLSPPEGYVWDGAGYAKDGAVVTLRYGDAFAGGEAGAPLVADAWDVASYFTGLDITRDGADRLLAWETTGPLVELLGFGPSPPNPIRLGPEHVDRFGEVQLDLAVARRGDYDGTTVELEATTAVFGVSDAHYVLITSGSGTAERDGTTLTLTGIDLEIQDDYGGPGTGGRIDYTTTGPVVSTVGNIGYLLAARTETSMFLECTP